LLPLRKIVVLSQHCHAETDICVKFPYALKALSSVIQERWDSADFKPYRDAFPTEAQASPEAFEAHVKDLTAHDVKIAYLKNLQGESYCYPRPYLSEVHKGEKFLTRTFVL
jgi:methionine salvage enolase-phosphatase E1